jgi:hypothetical protein
MAPPNHFDRSTTMPAADPRVRLAPTRAGHRMLDGLWWPRTTDPVAEFPGLVRALDANGSRTVRLLLCAAGWSRRPHDLDVDGRTVTLAYFSDQPDSVLTANRADGGSCDLLVMWTELDLDRDNEPAQSA